MLMKRNKFENNVKAENDPSCVQAVDYADYSGIQTCDWHLFDSN